MTQCDWGAYLDGSMPADERANLQKALEADPRLQAQFRGYQGFVEQIREQGLALDVPQARLEATLSRVQKVRPVRRSAYPVLAAATLLFLMAFAYAITRLYDPYSQRGSAVVSTFIEGDYALIRGANWEDRIPRLQAFHPAITQVRYGRDWVKISYIIDREPMELTEFRGNRVSGEVLAEVEGGTILRMEKAIAVRGKFYSFILRGPQRRMKEIAVALASEKYVPPKHFGCESPRPHK